MSNSHRSHRRRKKQNNGPLMIAAAVLSVVVLGGAIALVSSFMDDSGKESTRAGGSSVSEHEVQATPRPKAGKALKVTTPDGLAYLIEAVGGGVSEEPVYGSPPPDDGLTYAYIDYVFTNQHSEAALFDLPPDIFVKRDSVPEADRGRCIPRLGTPKDMCAVAGKGKVIARVGDSPATYEQDGDVYMPAGASYLVRAVSDVQVESGTSQDDLGLYVWAVRFTTDRIARPAPFPS